MFLSNELDIPNAADVSGKCCARGSPCVRCLLISSVFKYLMVKCARLCIYSILLNVNTGDVLTHVGAL